MYAYMRTGNSNRKTAVSHDRAGFENHKSQKMKTEKNQILVRIYL